MRDFSCMPTAKEDSVSPPQAGTRPLENLAERNATRRTNRMHGNRSQGDEEIRYVGRRMQCREGDLRSNRGTSSSSELRGTFAPAFGGQTMSFFRFFCRHRNLMWAGGRYAECRRCFMKIECPWDWKLMEREKQESVSSAEPERELGAKDGAGMTIGLQLFQHHPLATESGL